MGEEGGKEGKITSKLREATRKIMETAGFACGSFSGRRKSQIYNSSSTRRNSQGKVIEENQGTLTTNNNNNNNEPSTKNLCAICLDPLICNSKGSSPGQAIFTAQCSHSFHFVCISSNVRHGSVTCPICRAHWTQLPRKLHNTTPCGPLSCNNQSDPILRILDDSIATFRVHRRTLLRSVRYDDDDPIELDYMSELDIPKLCFSLVPIPPSEPYSFHPALQVTEHPACPWHPHSLQPLTYISSSLPQSPTIQTPYITSHSYGRAHLILNLVRERATDLVLVASPNGGHLRLLKQAMVVVVFSLRHVDRLAIVTYSSTAARVFPLRRMTSYGKRMALQVIDRLFYMGQADPVEGLNKGVKVLEDRVHKNPMSCILHLSDNPTRPYQHHAINMELPSTSIHHFHVGFGFGASNGFVIHELEEFLAKMLGGVVREAQLRICGAGEEVRNGRVVRIGELRGREERRILVDMGDYKHLYVEYSYIEGDIDECVRRRGEIVVGILDGKRDAADDDKDRGKDLNSCRRLSSVESWDFHDPYMARRWAKHLHGYRL